MLKQNLSQKLLQKLSPQQIQFIKLLQLNTTDLEGRLEQELIENPALESGKDDDENFEVTNDFESSEVKSEAKEEEDDSDIMPDDTYDISDYTDNYDDNDSFQLQEDNSDDSDRKEMPFASTRSFHDNLIEQAMVVITSDEEKILARQIIGSIDEDGYLRRELDAIVNDLAFSGNIDSTAEQLEKVLHKIQQLDPPGIAARTLQECLLLQLQRKDHKLKEVQIAVDIIQHHMDDFIKKHYDKLTKHLKINEELLKKAITVITHLNPKPGESNVEAKTQYIIPDFFLVNDDGNLEVTLNSRNAPDLKVSRSYIETLRSYEKNPAPNKNLKETVQFIKQKLDSAKWFIDSIKQRQNTLLVTMNAIVKYQYEYFMDGDETKLKPMILKDIADEVGLDISTISRVANSKYVQTEFGIFALKFFFSEGIQTDDGEEVSNKEVKKILTDCIGGEDKTRPLPDEKLMEILKEKGYNIARRTVAKYREQLNIPVARLRRELQ
jgi:RNA polymerase sigma-54 factor